MFATFKDRNFRKNSNAPDNYFCIKLHYFLYLPIAETQVGKEFYLFNILFKKNFASSDFLRKYLNIFILNYQKS